MNQQNVYPLLNSTLKIKNHNCFIIIILYTPWCREASRLDINIFNQIIKARMRLYRDSLSGLPRLNWFSRPWPWP